MNKIYLDHSATTRTDEDVAKAMLEYMTDIYGNPSSVHSFGRSARKVVEEAREKVAKAIGAEPNEIIFTSGGTEADNLAIRGVAFANKKRGNHIITSSIEHHAVLDACKALEREGFQVTYLPVDENGMVNIDDIRNAITDQTILISIMHANNEVGTIQPIREIGALARDKGVFFHSDTVQSVGKIPVDVNELNIDLLSISAHKFYGPKGIGCLYMRKGVRMLPISFGGSQERKRRPGTLNVPGIAGFGLAIEKAVASLEEQAAFQSRLRDKLIRELTARVKDIKLNGHPTERLPNNVNLSFRYIEGESLLLSLDMKGVAASSGSACTSGSLDPSHVLLALGLSHEIAHGSLRMTLGKDNTEAEIDYVIEVLPEIVERLRAMSPLYAEREKANHQSKECCSNVQ
ncbi:cysteine desulfurase NifS [Phosphitispora fastidiosa]|uniref:cysteine desulfurase NifS n=1 Tax=Phosphitispora fastidiosa TaxID=2837202 RepID=UPI002F42A817|nr:cysteine desulfurase [Phosphitispora fastidiosa]